ncbi:MAG: RNA polymerase sigma factor [Rubripirellula sp.]
MIRAAAEHRNVRTDFPSGRTVSPQRRASSVEIEEEASLIRRTREGSHSAFAELVQRHHRLVRVILGRYLRDDYEVDEVAQRAFIEAFRSIDQFRGESNFGSWVVAIARRQAAMFVRSESRRRKRETTVGELALLNWNQRGVEETADTAHQLKKLSECLKRLPGGSHSLVTRYYFERQSIEGISAEQGRSQGALRMQLMRIRSALAECISQRADEDR